MKVILLFLCFAVYSDQRSTPDSDSYVAAVAEYEVQADVNANVRSYVQLVGEAAQQDADVVVFPEMTLTRGSRAVPVPIHGLLRQFPIPYLRTDLYDEILVALSEAARNHEIYVVINVQEVMDCSSAENEYCPEQKEYMFNTNVVFDRTGAVIDRYRKINLFGEFSRTPALQPDLGLFATDFGVTFGHYVCFDLMFQVPAVQVVEKYNLTDVIFTTMWFSEMPYLTAVQIQEAYAYAMDVNFIASGANNVRRGSAGSGIYSGKAGALVSIMPGQPTTRLLVSRVPKVPGQVTFNYPGPIYDEPSDHDNLVLISDPSLPSHITRPLVPGFQEFTLFDKEVSCRFRVNLQLRDGQTRYYYRAAAFSGIRSFSGVETGGSRLCSVVACYGNTIETCGIRFDQYTVNSTGQFEELTITATVPTPVTVLELEAKDSAFFPVSLGPSILPLEPDEYDYDVNTQDNITLYTLNLKNTAAELYAFSVWGRVFERDGLAASPPVEDEYIPGNPENSNEDTGVDDPDSAVVSVVSSFLLALSLMLTVA